MKKLTQRELDETLNAHEEWWESRDKAHREIWQNAVVEQKSRADTDWAEAKLKQYKLRGAEIQIIKDLDLSGLSLAGRNLSRVSLENLNLSEADLQETWFAKSKISDVIFNKANLSNASFEEGILNNVSFLNSIMLDVEIHSLKISKNLVFDFALLDGASFVKSSIDFASFKNASLRKANLRRSEIYDSTFENADLREADFTYVVLKRCKTSGANIEGADFSDFREIPEEWKSQIQISV